MSVMELCDIFPVSVFVFGDSVDNYSTSRADDEDQDTHAALCGGEINLDLDVTNRSV